MRKFLILMMVVMMVPACDEPDFHDAAGNGHRFEELRGKWLFVNYWATWCAPCIKEIPEFNELMEAHGEELVVYGVNYDEPAGEEMARQIRKMKIEFPVFSKDPADKLGIERPEVLPTTFVFSPDGEHVETLVGPQTRETLLAVMEDAGG